MTKNEHNLYLIVCYKGYDNRRRRWEDMALSAPQYLTKGGKLPYTI